jgi:hypothetical protein
MIGVGVGEGPSVAAGVSVGLAGELALAQFQHGRGSVGNGEAALDAAEDAAAVVRHQQLQVHGRLAHRHRHLRAAAVVDGVVQQFGEGVLGHARHLWRQRKVGCEVA